MARTKISVSKGYSLKKTLLKGLEVFVMAGIGALISYLGNLPKTETIVIAVTLLKMLQNYLKHRNA